MYNTFNMGIAMAVIVPAEEGRSCLQHSDCSRTAEACDRRGVLQESEALFV